MTELTLYCQFCGVAFIDALWPYFSHYDLCLDCGEGDEQ
mgnify:CR=1 FL=1